MPSPTTRQSMASAALKDRYGRMQGRHGVRAGRDAASTTGRGPWITPTNRSSARIITWNWGIGRGEVIAALVGGMVLVRRIGRPGDDQPPNQIAQRVAAAERLIGSIQPWTNLVSDK